jgi:hypothetical protein
VAWYHRGVRTTDEKATRAYFEMAIAETEPAVPTVKAVLPARIQSRAQERYLRQITARERRECVNEGLSKRGGDNGE